MQADIYIYKATEKYKDKHIKTPDKDKETCRQI